jgi:acetolactate decarboxylase
MIMKTLKVKKSCGYLLLSICLPIALLGCAHSGDAVLYQTSPIGALMKGLYDGGMTFAELKKHGDFGIGTFDRLDGEMIELGGNVYQVRADGRVFMPGDSMKTPFAVVTFFRPDKTVLLEEVGSDKDLEDRLDALLPTKNIFYAVRVEGRFDLVKTRSVPSQHKPYAPLVEVVRDQSVFELRDIEGTIVGFRSPDFVEGVNVPGYHLHFIARDKTAGGHLLDCRIRSAKVAWENITEFSMTLPVDAAFYQLDLGHTNKSELERVEKQGEKR